MAAEADTATSWRRRLSSRRAGLPVGLPDMPGGADAAALRHGRPDCRRALLPAIGAEA